MTILLNDILTELNQFATALSKIVGLNITIVDCNLTRIVGTGMYRKLVGQVIHKNSLFDMILIEGKQYILKNRLEDGNCRRCLRLEKCHVVSQAAAPIMVNGTVAGIISLQAYDEAGKQMICTHGRDYLRLLDIVNAWIDVKLNALSASDELFSLINILESPTVLITETGEITGYNEKAKHFLAGVYSLNKEKIQNHIKGAKLGDLIDPTFEKSVSLFIKGSLGWERKTCRSMPIKTIYDTERRFALSFQNCGQSEKSVYVNTHLYTLNDIVTANQEMIAIKKMVQKIASSELPVLITGESGTGKELFATAIHSANRSSEKPFVAINCSAIPESLLESELFGFEDGSFTGARKGGRLGKFELADGGTFFLDEIDSMPLHLQAKILRVLETGIVERVGSNKPIKLNVRIIAATSKNLSDLVEKELFREDLYYRISVVPLNILPLRERREDILILLDRFVKDYCSKYKRKIRFSQEAMDCLLQYSWPGNVRELKNVAQYCMAMSEGSTVSVEDLPSQQQKNQTTLKTLDEMEKEHFLLALRFYGTSEEGKNKIAEVLGISRASVYRKINKYREKANSKVSN